MKIFDYKLILLLALTFVIYFMYREMQTLNKRIETLETKKDNVENKLTDNDLPKFINFNKVEERPDNIINNLNTNLNNLTKSYETEKKIINDFLPNNSCTISTEDEDSDEELSQLNKRNLDEIKEEDAVEIYSNDNVESISTQQSSEENLEIKLNKKINADVFLDDDQLYSLENMNISATSTDSPRNISSNILSNNANITQVNLDDKIESTDLQNSSNIDKKVADISVEFLLKKNKLGDLKEIANKLEIKLRLDGKAKTKKQLAIDIFSLKTNQ